MATQTYFLLFICSFTLVSLFCWSWLQIVSGLSCLFTCQGLFPIYKPTASINFCPGGWFQVLISSCLNCFSSLSLFDLPPLPVHLLLEASSGCSFPALGSACRVQCTLLSQVFCFLQGLAPTCFSGYLLLCSLTYWKWDCRCSQSP